MKEYEGEYIKAYEQVRRKRALWNNNGFEIIGISTDRIRYKEKWEEAIQKYALLWPQYWDQDGVASSKLSIINFLPIFCWIVRDILSGKT